MSCVQWHCYVVCAVALLCRVCSGTVMSCVQWHCYVMCAVALLCRVCSGTVMSCVQWHCYVVCAVALLCRVCSGTVMSCVQWHCYVVWAVALLCCVQSTATIIHYIQQLLTPIVYMPYSYNSWRLKELKDELKKEINSMCTHKERDYATGQNCV